ncbi:hypothetical protein N9777_08325 [Ascidiaceihabitans sp.]|nr:hypothetical protein [Ascidiaceihabitans sp.]
MTRTAYQNIDALIYLRENNTQPIVSALDVQCSVTVSKWTLRHRTRKALCQLTELQSPDVGLTPLQTRREAAR